MEFSLWPGRYVYFVISAQPPHICTDDVDVHLVQIGDCRFKSYIPAEPETSCVDLNSAENITASSLFILVGSDGFWNAISEEEITELLRKWMEPVPPSERAAHWVKWMEQLIAAAQEKDSSDNTTVLGILFK